MSKREDIYVMFYYNNEPTFVKMIGEILPEDNTLAIVKHTQRFEWQIIDVASGYVVLRSGLRYGKTKKHLYAAILHLLKDEEFIKKLENARSTKTYKRVCSLLEATKNGKL